MALSCAKRPTLGFACSTRHGNDVDNNTPVGVIDGGGWLRSVAEGHTTNSLNEEVVSLQSYFLREAKDASFLPQVYHAVDGDPHLREVTAALWPPST